MKRTDKWYEHKGKRIALQKNGKLNQMNTGNLVSVLSFNKIENFKKIDALKKI